METTKLLKELQDIQMWALEHRIFSFQVEVSVYPYDDEGEGAEGLIREYGDTHERIVRVVIFKTGDDSDNDYFSVAFHEGDSIFRNINNIKAFIGYV